MAAAIEQRTRDLETSMRRRKPRGRKPRRRALQVVEQLATIAQQRTVIQETSVPILPVTGDAWVMPLVGATRYDAARVAANAGTPAARRVAARYLILDITGVPVVDTQVAQGLIQVIQAARLLGAEVVLVGIRPEIAQTMVGLGIQFTTREHI